MPRRTLEFTGSLRPTGLARQQLAESIVRHDVDQTVVAIPSASAAQKRKLIERIKAVGLPVKILPGLVEMVDGHAAVAQIREVDVADLLGRDPVAPAAALFLRNITGKVVMVTGAGGSIGSELCRQIVSQRPRRLVLIVTDRHKPATAESA